MFEYGMMRRPRPGRFQPEGYGVVDTWDDAQPVVWRCPIRRDAGAAVLADLRLAPHRAVKMADLLNGTGPRAERARREVGL